MPNRSFDKLTTLREIEGPISVSGLDRNPQNIYIYSSGYDPAPSPPGRRLDLELFFYF